MKNKYNIGQEVVIDGENYFILKFRELFGTYQYSVSKERDGEFCFACGEQSIDYAVDESHSNHQEEASKADLSKVLPDREFERDDSATLMNTTAAYMRKSIDGSENGISPEIARLVGSSLFFKPNRKMVKWLVEYANGRMMIDVGAGQGHLVRMIRQCGGKAIGLEPNFDVDLFIKKGRIRYGDDFNANEMLPWTVERAQGFINGFRNKAILIFARPCHSNFVFQGIRNMPNEMEALYITVPKNLEIYDDLGPYKENAKLLEHEGISEDSEVVYSIKK